MTKLPKPLTYTLAVFAMLFWGMTFVWSKVVFKYYDPIVTITIRLLISSIIMGLMMLLFFKSAFKNPLKHIKWFLILALFEPFLYFIGESFGLLLVDASITAVVISTIPIFTAIMGVYFFKEKLSRLNIAGIAISFMGVLLMLFNNQFQIKVSFIGISLLMLAVFSAVGYSTMLRKISPIYHPVQIILVQNLIGFFMFLFVWIFIDTSYVWNTKLNYELWSSLLMLAVFGSSLAFMFFTITIREFGVAKSNVFSNLIPIFTAITAYFVLDEKFTIVKLSGMAIAIFGLFLTQRKAKTEIEL